MGLPESGSSEFDTTHWSVIAATSGAERQRGLDYIYRAYTGPLRSHLRRFGIPENDVEDTLHDFLMAIFESGALARANPAQGRFRSYMLGALRNFISNRRHHEHAKKRGGGALHLSLDELGSDAAPGAADDERRFDEDWAQALFEHAVLRLNKELDRDAERSSSQDLRDLIFREQADSYTEIARRLKITIPAVKSRIFRLRKRFQEIIRSEVGRTVNSEADCEEELSYLCRVLSNPLRAEKCSLSISKAA